MDIPQTAHKNQNLNMTLISRYCYYTAILTILTNCGQNYNDAVYVEIVVASDKNCRKGTPAMVNQYSLKTSHKSGQAPNKTPPPPTWPIWNALFLLPNNIGGFPDEQQVKVDE